MSNDEENMLKTLDSLSSPVDLCEMSRALVSRRTVLRTGATCGLAAFLASFTPLLPIAEAEAGYMRRPSSVSFLNTHTGESFSGAYRVGGRYLPEAFERMNYVLRDFRTGEVFPMDPRTVDIIATIQNKVDNGAPVHIISGYRSPRTNAMLREASGGVARNSMHMYGRAIDFRIEGVSTRQIALMARGMKRGGVGYYPASDFVHVDSGPRRVWQG
ncbi:MAG: DUF882 domain-containing protein [Alphaproteobacteria bacterium]|nr:DUF882 domain-containing protein [Alphaproteobacteria bacterium]